METSFGNWVRRRRKALDLTQNDLARRVGCSSSLIFKIETDERRPSRQVAELLARELEVTAEQLDIFLKVARQEQAVLRMDDPVSMPGVTSREKPHSPRENQLVEENFPPRESSLPVFPTLFIGREHEIDIVLQQILDPACRLLTLTGPGGVGKTRLAVEVASRLDSAFSDGVYFLPMAGVNLPESIVTELANALDLSFSGPADPKLQVIQALRRKNALVILDNMEHLVEGSAVLGEILEQAPGVRMLLTSREPVHLRWEWIFEVQGLPVPEAARLDMFESNSAPALFVQRLRQATPQIQSYTDISVEDAQAILQICSLVDGLPLAIELAASWGRVMSPAEIAAELGQGLDLLETEMQDIPTRHRSIRLVFDHSWKLLTGEERAAILALSAYPGGFTRETAQKAAGASVRLLSALVGKSLLRYRKQAGRYDFHELVRQYALMRLGEDPALERLVHTRLAEYFADWLASLEKPLKSAQQVAISTQVRAETANWDAAWRWAVKQQRFDLLRKMEFCLYWYFEIHGDNAEAVPSMTYAVDALRSAGAPHSLVEDYQKGNFALLVDQLGWFEFRIGNVERAAALFAESLEIALSMSEPDHEVLYYIHVNWGYMALVTGDFASSVKYTQTSLEHARAINGHWHAAIAVNILGIIEYQLGHLEEADQQLTGSLKMWREVGDLRGLVFCMLYLSAAVLALGDYDRVETLVNESNTITQHKGDRWAHAFGLDLLGNVALARGEPQRAVEYFQQSLALSQEIGDQWAVNLSLIHLGDALFANGDRSSAQQLFLQAYQQARQAGWLSTILETLVTALAAEEETKPQTRLAMIEAILSHPAANLSTRQRAKRLHEKTSAVLAKQDAETAQTEAKRKTVEEWAAVFFLGNDAKNQPLDLAGWTSSLQITPAA